MNYHSPREIIDIVSIMYIKAQNLARELNNKNMSEDDIRQALDDLKEHAKQLVHG